MIDRLNAEVNQMMLDPDFKARVNNQSLDLYAPSTVAQFNEFMRREHARWGAAVKPLKIE